MQASDFMIRYGYVSNMTKNSYICYVPTPKNLCEDTTHLSYPAYARNAITPIAESWKIEQETDSSIVVNWSKFLSEPIEGVDPFGGKTSPGRPLPQLNKILQVDVHEKEPGSQRTVWF